MSGHDEVLNGLAAKARGLIVRNAMPSAVTADREPVALEKQWWNLPAKYKAAERIKTDVLRNYPGWNDAGDAARHAELSRRMASEIDPLTAYAAGVGHELENSIPVGFQRLAPPFLRQHAEDNWHGQGTPERLMDERNNAEGRRAAREHRPVDFSRLQLSPGGPAAAGAPYTDRANSNGPRR